MTDHGFRESLGLSNSENIEQILEILVFHHLKQRGYELYIGKIGSREIGFIACKDKSLEYYQVSYLLSNASTREREFGVYTEIKDNYPKFVLSLDEVDFSQQGIKHKNLIDFLLE